MQVYAWMVSLLWIFWNLVVEVFHSSQNQLSETKGLSVQGKLLPNTSSNKRTRNQAKVSTKHDNFDWCNVDSVPSNVKFFSIQCYVVCVPEQWSSYWSPLMRHVSRNHRVALDWLFDRINLDPRIEIRTSTPNISLQTLTKGSFTRYEWNSLLHLCNISHFTCLCCAQNFSLTGCPKRWRWGCKNTKKITELWQN